ncbi:ABC transporter ATP-binding protein [Nocardiopsis synnemataformans]|uniref:ABC transporter ATP-binding protein n=1 Tax=Nocardiopsis synnemataformans TaxID=61305 RepID=UPI003EB79223
MTVSELDREPKEQHRSEAESTPESTSRPTAGFRDVLPLLKPYRVPLIIAFSIGVLGSAAGAVQPLVVSSIVDTFNSGLPLGEAALLVMLLFVSAVLTGLRELVIERTGEKFAYDSRQQLVDHIYSLPMARLEIRDRADMVTRVTTDVSETRNFLTSGLIDLAISVITVLISLIMMALIDPFLLGLSFAAVLVIFIVILALGKKTRPVGLQVQNALGALAESVSRSIGSMKMVRATRAAGRESDKAMAEASEVRRAGFKAAGLRAMLQTVSGVSVQVLLIVIVGFGALRVTSGILTTGELSAFIMYLMLMVTPIAMVGNVVASLGEAFGALARILEIHSEPAEPDVQTASISTVPEDTDEVFRFEEVSFQYARQPPGGSDGAELSLSGVSFSVTRGETVAFVGPSGAGKTTVFSLLERFYEPTGGRILFRGRDVREMSRDELRGQMAYVDQDAVVLSGNVRENLNLSADEATDVECIAALKQVGLVQNDAAGRRYLEREVGELGTRLSGGQRQRLAIARALLAGNPVLLLDEATSNLDSRNETMVQDALNLSEINRTTLVIAHRFSTVASADKIIVLDVGRVVAQGTHHELVQSCELYNELAKHQFLSGSAEEE